MVINQIGAISLPMRSQGLQYRFQLRHIYLLYAHNIAVLQGKIAHLNRFFNPKQLFVELFFGHYSRHISHAQAIEQSCILPIPKQHPPRKQRQPQIQRQRVLLQIADVLFQNVSVQYPS
jgi:hypothetical protein